jgi:hypothetical protein
VTRNAVSAVARPRAVAATSITLGPWARLTVLVKLLPLTWARWPWTLTRAPGGLTVPLTCAVALWTIAVSEGAETLSCTGFCGLGAGRVGAASRERKL